MMVKNRKTTHRSFYYWGVDNHRAFIGERQQNEVNQKESIPAKQSSTCTCLCFKYYNECLYKDVVFFAIGIYMMVDKHYIVSLLGCANLIELTLLAGAFIAVRMTSMGYAQLLTSYNNIMTYNITQTNDVDPTVVYDIDAYKIKQVDQTILIIIFGLTLFSFLAHTLLSLRYRYAWHRLSICVAFFCIIYAFALFGVSVVVACWEDKSRKRLTSAYLNNEVIATPDALLKPQSGSAAAAATFGFAACIIFLAEALIRFRRLADKIQS